MDQHGRLLHELIHAPQHNRILRLSYPKSDGPREQFLVNRLYAVEALSRDFEFTIELLCISDQVALKEMHGKLLAVELVKSDGALRYFTGYVFDFRRIRSNGGVTFYEARLGPWLKFLHFRQNSHLFHFKNLNDQAHAIFQNDPGYVNWTRCVIGDDPVMEDACQFQESDFNYLSRRWEEAGYAYWYEHSASGHQLVVSDNTRSALLVDGDGVIRFQAAGGSIEEDAIDTWSAARQMASTSVSVRGFDYLSSWPTGTTLETFNRQGTVPQVESYHYLGTHQAAPRTRTGSRAGASKRWKPAPGILKAPAITAHCSRAAASSSRIIFRTNGLAWRVKASKTNSCCCLCAIRRRIIICRPIGCRPTAIRLLVQERRFSGDRRLGITAW